MSIPSTRCVLDVDVVKSAVDLLVWIRLVWTDDRLAWNPDEYNGLDKVFFWIEAGAGASETSEIWTPDVELWNQMESIQSSFANGFAQVDSNGRVYWSRPGHLLPICKFEGLERFPFDNLVCTIELGSWSYSGKYLRLGLLDGDGVSIGGSNTSGEAFQEFTLKSVSASAFAYPPYPSDPLADWPVLFYKVVFDRSWQPYVRGHLVSQIIFNIIGFACFWLPIQSGERLGLSITAMLAAVASDLVVVSELPQAPELTWMQKFSMMSQVFAAYCVLEGVLVSFFFYQTARDLVPAYLQSVFNSVARMRQSRRERRKRQGKAAGNPHGLDGSDLNASARSLQPRDADDFQTEEDIDNNKRWKLWGEHIDDFSRVVIPVIYVIVLSVLFALQSLD